MAAALAQQFRQILVAFLRRLMQRRSASSVGLGKLTSGPLASSSSTTSLWPLNAGSCKAVSPSLVLALTVRTGCYGSIATGCGLATLRRKNPSRIFDRAKQHPRASLFASTD